MVFFTKGNAWLIKRKLKVGAIIISLTGIFACSSPHPTCYETISKKEADSIRLLDSLNKVKELKQNHMDDSISSAKEEKRISDSIDKKKKKKDSIANIKHKKKPNVIKPICYGAPANTCYSQVQTK